MERTAEEIEKANKVFDVDLLSPFKDDEPVEELGEDRQIIQGFDFEDEPKLPEGHRKTYTYRVMNRDEICARDSHNM